MGMRVGSRVVDTLFDLWFRAVLDEEIPSPTYWRTLAVLCRRWRHHLQMTSNKYYDYLTVAFYEATRNSYRVMGKEAPSYDRFSMQKDVWGRLQSYLYTLFFFYPDDDSIIPFGSLPIVKEDEEVDLLYHSWLFILYMISFMKVDISSLG
uniref:RALGAPB_N domain-containing protein n=1 Tax=Heterorhabditis bacteriophora TaxID=37862 RepID=A0A1I7XF76_HETBA